MVDIPMNADRPQNPLAADNTSPSEIAAAAIGQAISKSLAMGDIHLTTVDDTFVAAVRSIDDLLRYAPLIVELDSQPGPDSRYEAMIQNGQPAAFSFATSPFVRTDANGRDILHLETYGEIRTALEGRRGEQFAFGSPTFDLQTGELISASVELQKTTHVGLEPLELPDGLDPRQAAIEVRTVETLVLGDDAKHLFHVYISPTSDTIRLERSLASVGTSESLDARDALRAKRTATTNLMMSVIAQGDITDFQSGYIKTKQPAGDDVIAQIAATISELADGQSTPDRISLHHLGPFLDRLSVARDNPDVQSEICAIDPQFPQKREIQILEPRVAS